MTLPAPRILIALLGCAVLLAGCDREAGYSANFPALGLPAPSVPDQSQFVSLPPSGFEPLSEEQIAAVDAIPEDQREEIPGASAGAAQLAADTAAALSAQPAAPPPAPVAPPPAASASASAAITVNRDILSTYARATSNEVGQKIYRRLQISRDAARQACAQFGNSDTAQSAFLQRGGPAEDPLNIDSDGDGFACGWSPTPFRN